MSYSDVLSHFEGVSRKDLITIELDYMHCTIQEVFTTDKDGKTRTLINWKDDHFEDFLRSSGMRVGWHDEEGWPDMEFMNQVSFLASLGFEKIYLCEHPYNTYYFENKNLVAVVQS